ncbi:cytosine permease [Pseudonocardia sp.]|uniref:purine-cytosine permease family protein n=1 Tax=Pseudonocardia sp. TaxID=60912 RepID=UPI0031FC2724
MSTDGTVMANTVTGTGAAVPDKYDDYSLRSVPESEIKSTWDIALVRMGFTVSASDLVFGYTLGLFFSFGNALLIAAAYSVIIAVVSILMGIIGVRERTSFALTSRFAFGREGSRLPSLVMAVIIAAFYGYVLGITVDVFPKVGTAGQIAYSVALGLLFLLISGLGFERGLKWVGRFGVPLMIVLVLVAVIGTLTHVGGFGAIIDAHPKQAGGMTLAGIIGLGVSKWLAGATVTPDLLRFGRNTGTVITTTAAEFLVGNLGFNFLGLILGLGLGKSDLGTAFALLGLTWLATAAFVLQSITVEMNELYAASLAASNGIGMRRTVTNVVVGVVGIGIGFYGISHGIIANFLTFIGYVGYALPAIPAIIIADYFVVQRMHYPAGLSGLPAVNWRAIASFVITVALNIYLGVVLGDVLWHSLPLIGGVVYILLSLPQLSRAWSTRGAPAREPVVS